MLFLFAAAPAPAQEGDRYRSAPLVSARFFGPAETADSSLVNPWGMANDLAGGPWWVADEGRGRATLYSEGGLPFPGFDPLVVNIPKTPGSTGDYSTPTGVVYNATPDFELAPGVPARFIFVTKEGGIAGWNGEQGRRDAVLLVDNSPEAVYTGAAIASVDGENVLFVANFRQGRIEAFGPDFSPLTLKENAFIDPYLPNQFSPFNVRAINKALWVTYAMTGADGRRKVSGPGLGYVDVFDMKGDLLLRLEHGSWLDAPWGIAPAPGQGFGEYSNAMLIANEGSGRIAAFDEENGAFLGFLKDGANEPLALPGLHGLGFGNDGIAGPSTTLYYTAGLPGRSVFGFIVPASTPGTGEPAFQP